MTDHLLLTIAGPDKTGLVRDLADLVTNLQGNWLRSRLTHLSGHFAGVVEIELPANQQHALDAALDTSRANGLHASIHALSSQNATLDTRTSPHVRLSVVGNDRAGIVASISQALALHGVNVEELHSDVEDAPMASGPLFRAEIVVSYTDQSQLDGAREAIEALAHDLMIDIADS